MVLHGAHETVHVVETPFGETLTCCDRVNSFAPGRRLPTSPPSSSTYLVPKQRPRRRRTRIVAVVTYRLGRIGDRGLRTRHAAGFVTQPDLAVCLLRAGR